jgi:hypothetical protein
MGAQDIESLGLRMPEIATLTADFQRRILATMLDYRNALYANMLVQMGTSAVDVRTQVDFNAARSVQSRSKALQRIGEASSTVVTKTAVEGLARRVLATAYARGRDRAVRLGCGACLPGRAVPHAHSAGHSTQPAHAQHLAAV